MMEDRVCQVWITFPRRYELVSLGQVTVKVGCNAKDLLYQIRLQKHLNALGLLNA